MGNTEDYKHYCIDDIDAALGVVARLRLKLEQDKKPLQFISAMIYVMQAVENGETLETFKPLKRDIIYAGSERRKKEDAGSMHRGSA